MLQPSIKQIRDRLKQINDHCYTAFCTLSKKCSDCPFHDEKHDCVSSEIDIVIDRLDDVISTLENLMKGEDK